MPKRLEAFLEQRVAAAMLTPPSSGKALEAGGVLLARAEDYIPHWPLTCGWGCGWLESHRELVVRFIRAWVAATDWLLDLKDRAETSELIIEKEHLKWEAAQACYRKVVPKARINPMALQTVIELRKEMGTYAPPLDPPERFYDSRYWREATGLTE